MQSFQLEDLISQQARMNNPYFEFLRKRSMSCGLYVLAVGSEDPQQPHNQDEVYVVIGGEAKLTVANRAQPVSAGTIVFVPAYMPHFFHDIVETLQVLVFFAPAET